MPKPGMLWRHVICNTKCTWLHGDKRGFRDRDHRLHFSGDYKNPPPTEEHEGLRDWATRRSTDSVEFKKDLRPLVARAFAARLIKEGYRVLCVSCSSEHLHALTELPADRAAVKTVIGRCKRNACYAVAKELSGPIWAADGEYKIVKDASHQRNAFDYIKGKQGRGTFVWTHDGSEHWLG